MEFLGIAAMCVILALLFAVVASVMVYLLKMIWEEIIYY